VSHDIEVGTNVSCEESTVIPHTGLILWISVLIVDKFFYLGYMLSIDRDADAVVEARVWKRWDKFRQLTPLLTCRDFSLFMMGIQRLCVKLYVTWQ